MLDIVPRHTFYDIASILNQLDTGNVKQLPDTA